MNDAISTANGRDEGGAPDAPAEQFPPAGRESDQPAARESFARQMGRGLLLVVLGVASHLWIDAQRHTVPSTDGAGVTAAYADDHPAEDIQGRPGISFGEPARQVDPGLVTAGGPDTSYETALAADTMPSLRGSQPPGEGTLVVGTSGRSATTGPARGNRGHSTRHVTDASAASRSQPEPREPEALLASASVALGPTADEAEPQLQTWGIVNAIDAAPLADRTRRAHLRGIEMAPLSASLPTTSLPTSGVAAKVTSASEVAADSSDEHLIRAVLQQYQRALNELDARAASRVYPTVDQRALARAFSHLQAQSITLEDCGVTLASSAAQATCRGVATYVPKVGGGARHLTREWRFSLARTTDTDWRIQTVN
jgi:hypothetical protein